MRHLKICKTVFTTGENCSLRRAVHLKPPKRFYTLLEFEWNAKGKWKYKLHHEDISAQLYVPIPDETHENIEHVSAHDHEAKETLGIYTCPSGDYKKLLEIMAEKTQGWIDRASEGKLHWRMAWFSIDRQFWPKVSYGICCNPAPLPQLQSLLKKKYRTIVSLGGIAKTANTDISMTASGLYGAGLQHPGVETAVAHCNKLLMHYRCDTSVGSEFQISIELFLLEIGASFQPLQLQFDRYADMKTHCWFKTLWKKASTYGFTIIINNISLKFSRRGDKWLMA